MIELVLHRLGHDRVRKALVAFDHPVNMWTTCVLARAYGPVGELWADMSPYLDDGVMAAAAACLGIPIEDVRWWCAMFDRFESRAQLKRQMEAFLDATMG